LFWSASTELFIKFESIAEFHGEKKYFSSSKQLIAEHGYSLDKKVLLLTDFQLLDGNGIELIKQFSHFENSILTTARSEEREIQIECKNLGIRILPKSIMSFLKVSTKTLIVLIDDDKLMNLDWGSYLQSKNVPFLCFTSIADFVRNSSKVTFDAYIYIDSNLKDEKGEIDSINIFKLGYRNLFLTTGYQKEDIIKPYWIKSIKSKNPRTFL
jgi:hypothetical protein